MSNSSVARFAAAAGGGGGCVVARRRRRRRCNDGCFSSGRGARERLLDDDEDRFRRLRGKSLKAAKETVTGDDDEEEERKKQRQRDHRKRNRKRNKEKTDEVVEEVLEKFLAVLKPFREDGAAVSSMSSMSSTKRLDSFLELYVREDEDEDKDKEDVREDAPMIINWSEFPKSADPVQSIGTAKKTSEARGIRKRKQIEQIYKALRSRNVLSDGRISNSTSSEKNEKKRKTIVDFGCGTGNLLLALAFLFPEHDFIGVDLNETSIRMLEERAANAKLTNVRSKLSLIETFDEDFDVALALHVCGKATDVVLQTCVEKQKDFVCVPCCVGKVQVNGHRSVGGMRKKLIDVKKVDPTANTDGNIIRHPRSNLMRSICDEETFMEVAKLADWSGNDTVSAYEESAHSRLPAKAKSAVEIDRAQRCVERGYRGSISLHKMHQCGLRNDLILGVVE
jgi:hypothetical protein